MKSKLDAYLETVDDELAATVTGLHEAIMAARPDLKAQVSYQMLMYALNGDFRHWIVSVGASGEVVTVRFLFGSFMRDPELWFKPAKGSLRTVDFSPRVPVDAALVGAYVNEAIIQSGALRSL